MLKHIFALSVLLSAGADLAIAVPHPQFGFFGSQSSIFPTYSFPGYGHPSRTPSGLPVPSVSGVGLAAPTGFSSGRASYGPTGTGFGSSVCSVIYTTISSIPHSTGVPIPESSSVALVSDSSSAVIVPSSQISSLAAAASVSDDPSSSRATSSQLESTIISTSSSVAPASDAPTSASISASSGCTFTDADAAAASKGSCSAIVLNGITVPAGKTLDLTDLNDGTTVSFEGTTTFEYAEWEGPLLYISGSSITITGASGHVIDGNGAKWWDGEGSNGGVTKPKFFYAHDLTDSTISSLNIQNTPVQAISVDGAKNLRIEEVTIDNSDGDTQGGHNTDCFDIGESTGVHLSGITCKNQDDCMAINSGTDISFTGGTCSGGHGLSIGSVGGRDDNTVEDIYIASSSISDSENGVRIKCNSGDTGSVTNVTYSGITLSGITDYGIVIEQDYENGDPTGTPTDGIPITDLTLEDISGGVTDDAQAYYILCAACSDWTVSNVDVTGGSQSADCEGVPSGASDLC